jgi:hypothetical protein
MDAQQTFIRFISRVLVREKAQRFTSLAATKKGRRKILDGLCHEFEPAILPTAIREKDYNALFGKPCFIFYAPTGFGIEFSAVGDAYEELSTKDSWLILLSDASAGIYRPEGRWDNERFIVA